MEGRKVCKNVLFLSQKKLSKEQPDQLITIQKRYIWNIVVNHCVRLVQRFALQFYFKNSSLYY